MPPPHPPEGGCLYSFEPSHVTACVWFARVRTPPSVSASSVCPSQSQGFQVVCEAARSDSSSSPASAEQSCRRGNSVEKGGPSQQPPPVKGPSKKK